MKLYILVEDGKSFFNILPKWLNVLIPTYKRARTVDEMSENSYVLHSGVGYPSVLGIDASCPEKNRLGSAIDTVNVKGDFDFLIICLDADDVGVEKREKEADEKICNYTAKLKSKYKVLVQNKCVETWIMGNQEVFPTHPTPEFLPYYNHYNVKEDDPENMEKPAEYTKTTAIYHDKYLRMMLRESDIYHTKGKPSQSIQEQTYFGKMIERIKNTNHLNSFRSFVDFFGQLNESV